MSKTRKGSIILECMNGSVEYGLKAIVMKIPYLVIRTHPNGTCSVIGRTFPIRSWITVKT